MDIFKIIETDKIIIFEIYYKRYGLIDTLITYIKHSYRSIQKIKSEICYEKTYFLLNSK